MLTCSNILLILLSLFIIYMVSCSRKNNICLLISFAFGILLDVIFYLLISVNGRDFAIEFAENLKEFSSLPELTNQVVSLVYGLWLIILFLIGFVASAFISPRIITIDSVFTKRKEGYIASKVILIFFNVIIVIFVLSFGISIINILYDMPLGFLSVVFEIFGEWVFRL